MEIATIGFTKHSAESFFGILNTAGVKQLLDIRVNNVSQLAGFAKRDDLRFFLHELCGASYRHEPMLAPTADLLKRFRAKDFGWEDYEKRFLDLIDERDIATMFSPDLFREKTVLLCSEHEPDHCHRRLIAEYFRDRWGDVTLTHL